MGSNRIRKVALGFLLITFLLGFSLSHAALLGVKDLLQYPDITFDMVGALQYTVDVGGQQGTLNLYALDWKITMTKDGPVYYLTDTNAPFYTGFYLEIKTDTSGNLIRGTMREQVLFGDVVVEGKTYSTGTVLLQGNVYAFGFLKGDQGLLHQFDFLVKDVTGALVDDGFWPKNVPTGIYLTAFGSWDGTFDKNFSLGVPIGDKAPVPVPASVILLGSGLTVLGLRKMKKSRRG